MATDYFSSLDLKVVILSRGRSKTITSHKLFPAADLCVPASEVEAYGHTGNPINPVPDEVRGLGPLRNWILDHYPQKIVVMVDDDDVTSLYVITGKLKWSLTDPDTILQVIMQAAKCAEDLGTAVFGFNQDWDVRKYAPHDPFRLTGWVGGVIGVIGRDIHFMQDQRFKVDVDFCLETLLQKRVIWKDERFSFYQIRDKNLGGNSAFRTREGQEQEIQKLRNKWGRYFGYKFTKMGESTQVRVPRKNRLNLD